MCKQIRRYIKSLEINTSFCHIYYYFNDSVYVRVLRSLQYQEYFEFLMDFICYFNCLPYFRMLIFGLQPTLPPPQANHITYYTRAQKKKLPSIFFLVFIFYKYVIVNRISLTVSFKQLFRCSSCLSVQSRSILLSNDDA